MNPNKMNTHTVNTFHKGLGNLTHGDMFTYQQTDICDRYIT